MGLPAVRPFAAAYPSEACWHWLCVSGMLSLPHGVCWAVQKQLSKEKGGGAAGGDENVVLPLHTARLVVGLLASGLATSFS